MSDDAAQLRKIGGGLLLSSRRCNAIEPMAEAVGVVVFCERPIRHTGKHIHHNDKGSVQWWKAHTDTHAAALGAADG